MPCNMKLFDSLLASSESTESKCSVLPRFTLPSYKAVGWLVIGVGVGMGVYTAKVDFAATEDTPSIFHTYMSNTINAEIMTNHIKRQQKYEKKVNKLHVQSSVRIILILKYMF